MNDERYEIHGRPSIPAMAVSAGVTVVGMIVMGLASGLGWGQPAATIGLVVVILGILFMSFDVAGARGHAVVATLSSTGFALLASGKTVAREWGEVTKVTAGDTSLTVHTKDGQGLQIQAPKGTDPEKIQALAVAMAKHLDADRGYQHFA